MTLTDLKTTLSTLPDDQLIQMAGEILGRKIGRCVDDGRYMWEEYEYGPVHAWNPLESETDAFELVDFIYKKTSLYFNLRMTIRKWLARYIVPSENLSLLDESRTRAIVKASILAHQYWKEKSNET